MTTRRLQSFEVDTMMSAGTGILQNTERGSLQCCWRLWLWRLPLPSLGVYSNIALPRGVRGLYVDWLVLRLPISYVVSELWNAKFGMNSAPRLNRLWCLRTPRANSAQLCCMVCMYVGRWEIKPCKLQACHEVKKAQWSSCEIKVAILRRISFACTQ